MSGKKRGDQRVDIVKAAQDATEQMMSMLRQISDQDGSGTGDTDIENLPLARATFISSLAKAMTTTPIEDVSAIPAESILTLSTITDDFKHEAKELALVEENLRSNVSLMDDFNKNFEQRNNHLSDIVEGMHREVNAIEEMDPNERFQDLRSMKRKLRKALNIILEGEFPELKNDVKCILEGCMQLAKEQKPYMKLPDDVDLQAVMLLRAAEIIEEDEDDPSFVKLAEFE